MSKSLAFLFCAILAATNAVAQIKEGYDDSSTIIYKIKSGDTLNQFALKYLQHPVDMDAIQAANPKLNLDRIKIGTEVNIPRQLLKHSPSKAIIMGLSCGTAIRIGEASKPLAIGSVINEGAVIEVPAECHVALLLEDSSIIRLPSSATLKITTLRKNALESAPEVRLDLARGRVELDVHKGRSKTTPFEIRTPLSIMGVRGTEFRVGYSPEDQASQVEVLGGVVQTRGSADSQANAITKGLGVPIDAAGNALAIEKLLDAPTYMNAERTPEAQPSYAVTLTHVPQAHYYLANITNTANLAGPQMSQKLLAPEIFISRLTTQAVFYQLSAVSHTELIGTERIYGFCSAPTTKTPRCSAVFDASLADTSPITFSLTRTDNGVNQEVLRTQALQARNGRFAIRGLPAGQYQWALAYDMTQPGQTTHLHQSGTFELIVMPHDLP